MCEVLSENIGHRYANFMIYFLNTRFSKNTGTVRPWFAQFSACSPLVCSVTGQPTTLIYLSQLENATRGRQENIFTSPCMVLLQHKLATCPLKPIPSLSLSRSLSLVQHYISHILVSTCSRYVVAFPEVSYHKHLI